MSQSIQTHCSGPDSQSTQRACLLALLSLSKMGPGRLARLLEDRSAPELWEVLCSKELSLHCDRLSSQAEVPAKQIDKWAEQAHQLDPSEILRSYQRENISMAELGTDAYPDRLSSDGEPPAVLFWQGDIDALNQHRTVAVVGTRRCTNYGQEVAFELGQSLSAAGVSVISGLALGIDTAAHKGALAAAAAPPIGVVGSGLNIVYPKANRKLWQQIASRGVLLSETPLDVPPERWRFPARNRVIAALADVVVIVESLERGGSLFTAEEALSRDKPVFAVPGSIRSVASAGTNKLIAEGASMMLDVNDILVALGLPVSRGPADAKSAIEGLSEPQQLLLDAFGWQPAGLDQLVDRTNLSLAEVSLALEELQSAGHIIRRGLWYERKAI